MKGKEGEIPYIILAGFESADGKCAPANREGRLFSLYMTKELEKELHRLRSGVDGVIVGIGTVLADDPKLTVRAYKGKNPTRIVLDSHARIPIDSKVLNKDSPAIVVISEDSSKEKIERLKEKAEVIVCGKRRINIRRLLEILGNRGFKRVLVEGGSTIRWAFIRNRLPNEVRIWIFGSLWGGKKAPTLVDGKGFLKRGFDLKLTDLKRLEGDIVYLKYCRR
jgi:2,5-diamino-6-(ribosylamino)-4(3H)-pyrimidinone 5'-phosphate reductase